MQILRAAEDYLEAMLMMQQKHGYIRSIDLAGAWSYRSRSAS